MTLSTSQPTDQELNATWPYWVRAVATAINEIEEGVSTTVITILEVLLGASTLTVGTDLSVADIEVIFITATGAIDIAYIYDGTEGQIKIFICGDNNFSITDGAANSGRPYLNQAALSTTNFGVGDVLALVNVDGDGGTVQGYWRELFRTISIR